MGRNPPGDNMGRPTSSRNPGQAKAGQGSKFWGKAVLEMGHQKTETGLDG